MTDNNNLSFPQESNTNTPNLTYPGQGGDNIQQPLPPTTEPIVYSKPTTPPPSFVTAAPLPSPETSSSQVPQPPVFTQASTESSQNGPIVTNFKPKRKSKGMMIGIIIIILILIGGALVYFLLNKNNQTNVSGTTSNSIVPKQQVILTYWGLWEPTAVMQGIISEYQTQNPNVVINYMEQNKTDYRTRLQSALEGGTGPDIFRYHNTWFPMLKTVMQPDSNKNIVMDDYYPIIKENAVIGGETFGVPLGFDTLALYYNPQKFQSAGISTPPANWEELITDAEKLVVTDPRVGIQVGGIAMGTTNNVDHWSDIIGLLLMQNGSDPAVEIPAEVLQFYTQFVDTKKVWDATQPSSTYAFATEKVAMMFAPSWRAHEIKVYNPNLQFKTAPVPQLTGSTPVSWASYWLEGVSRRSKNTDEAWKFLAFLSNSENLTKLYTTAAQSSKERTFGEPYPRISLASSIQSDPIVGSFLGQGMYAKSWYLCSRTFDDGLNDGIIKYFEDSINAVNKDTAINEVLPTLTNGINQKLSLFGLSKSASSY